SDIPGDPLRLALGRVPRIRPIDRLRGHPRDASFPASRRAETNSDPADSERSLVISPRGPLRRYPREPRAPSNATLPSSIRISDRHPMQRHLVHPDEVESHESADVPVLVIGSGVAGLSAAIAAAESTDVLVVTKSWLSDSNTDAAQGGVAAVLGPGDTLEKH